MRSLKEYQKKRDFRATTEPKPAAAKKPNGQLIYVVQEHHASHLHWDLRLELDGVLKSWAVPKGPPTEKSQKRLAVEVEDHPLEYAEFEGTIPQGQYGAGEVIIWDRGIWKPLSEPHEGLKKGRLEFELTGERLTGKWLMVRTKGSGKKPNWLLMKRSSDTEAPTLSFIPPQLAQLQARPPSGKQWVHELKFDGYRIQALLENGKVRLLTRKGLDWTEKYPSLAKALETNKIKSAILDGEIVWMTSEGQMDFQRLQNSMRAGSDKNLVYYVFDLLHLDGKDLRSKTLRERKKLLKKVIDRIHHPRIRYSEDFDVNGDDFLATCCEHGFEGILSKRVDSTYRSARTAHWIKTKCKMRQEFVIGGFTEPQGSRFGFGALLIGIFVGLNQFRYVGRVGTGFNQKTLKEITTKLKAITRKSNPFTENFPRREKATFVEPKLVAEISFANWTDEGLLRAPVFHGLREDKDPREITIEKPSGSSEPITITNPEKVFFPKQGTTKAQIAEYYDEICEHILPWIRHRPLALVRCPDGVDKHCFFQKHALKGMPRTILSFPDTRKDKEDSFLTIMEREGLRGLAQWGVIEIHPWGCRYPELDHPDQVIFDIDPGKNVPWSEVVNAAFEMKDMLERLDLTPFVKLTGGKGLHVQVPIEPLYTWQQVKAFAKTFATEMADRHPHRYLTTMTKTARTGRIYVDYLRNSRGSTAIAPYALRANDSNSVAMPIEWRELRKMDRSDQFDMKAALQRLKRRRKDPWAEFESSRAPIPILKAVR